MVKECDYVPKIEPDRTLLRRRNVCGRIGRSRGPGQDLSALVSTAGVEDRATKGRPALAPGNGVLCMAWQGLDQNNIFVSVSRDNGAQWSPQKELNDRAPRAARVSTINDTFVMAWQGLDQNNVWVSVSKDGLTWSPQKELNDRSTSSSPAWERPAGSP